MRSPPGEIRSHRPVPQGVVAVADKLLALLQQRRGPGLGSLLSRWLDEDPRYERARSRLARRQPVAEIAGHLMHPHAQRGPNDLLQQHRVALRGARRTTSVFGQEHGPAILDRRLEAVLQCEERFQHVASGFDRPAEPPCRQGHGIGQPDQIGKPQPLRFRCRGFGRSPDRFRAPTAPAIEARPIAQVLPGMHVARSAVRTGSRHPTRHGVWRGSSTLCRNCSRRGTMQIILARCPEHRQSGGGSLAGHAPVDCDVSVGWTP